MRKKVYNVKQGQPYCSPVQVAAASGAITIQSGVVHLTKAGVAVMTLADPPKDANGAELIIRANTANAHTVTNTTGFDGAGAGGDVATFGGAVGDQLTLLAYDGVWRVYHKTNVTIA